MRPECWSPPSKRRAKAGPAAQRAHRDPKRLDVAGPRPGLVKTADRGIHGGWKPTDQLDNEALRAPRGETQHDLQHAHGTSVPRGSARGSMSTRSGAIGGFGAPDAPL